MGFFGNMVKKAVQPVVNNVRGAVGEKKVENKLNPMIFGRVEHKYINNLIIVDSYNKSHQIDHIEIRKNGIFCIETKNYQGMIFGSTNDETWTQCLGSARNTLRNPLRQNESHVRQLEKVLRHKYQVKSVVVFVKNNAASLDIPNVINLDDLPEYLKNYNDGTKYTSSQIDEIYERLKEVDSGLSNRQHVKNIKKTQKDIEKGICPLCGGKLVERTGPYGTFTGCSNYPKCHFKLNK